MMNIIDTDLLAGTSLEVILLRPVPILPLGTFLATHRKLFLKVNPQEN